MKRILSLTLLAAMLLSTLMLTSCNEVFNAVGSFVNDTIEMFFPSETIRTEVTEEEWKQMDDITNFTLNVVSGDQYMQLVLADNALKAYVTEDNMGLNVIIDGKNGVIISESCAGLLGYENDYMLDTISEIKLGTLGYLPTIEFADVTYNAEAGSYTYTNDTTTCEYYFRNGVLYEIKAVDANEYINMTLTINNIGTSVIEIGEYTIINDGKIDPSTAPANVVTTVTNEDLAAHLDMTNFTIKAATMQGTYAVDISLKLDDMKLELIASLLGSEMSKQYLALIDDEFYSIEKYGNGHLATPIGGTMAELTEAIEMAKEYISTDYLIYNEEGRYYKLDVDGVELYLYFENGKLVKGVYLPEASGSTGGASPRSSALEVVFVVTDIGSTIVTLPEYTINTPIVKY